ncbi:MAG: hypothetical protein Q8Q08_05380 [Candidatus Omnitrophota bacterium]|nr:hypothetical protein [Candidatus Omnitrophota bacterium]MDZ4242340.1 hypothetical protein [Candidatus Omnitrophota bacterium]
MDIGLYNMKYPVRKLISGVLPLVKNVEPNTVSWLMLPVGLAVAAAYYGAPGAPALYWAGIGLTFLRMYLGTLDGLMAEHYKKGSAEGEIVNRIAPEFCDAMYMLALVFAHPEIPLEIRSLALALAWLTTFAGLVGFTAKKPGQSVGPVGQTDRLAALILLSLLQYFSAVNGWQVNFIAVFFYWCIGGGAITVFLRLRRHLKTARSA